MPNQERYILLITDNRSIQDQIMQLLVECGYRKTRLRVLPSEKLDELGHQIRSTPIVILDDDLRTDASRLEMLQVIKRSHPTLSILMLTRRSNRQEAVEAMKRGSTDFIYKRNLNREVFERALKYCLERCELQEDIEQRNVMINALFDQSKDAIFLLDHEQKVILTNRVFDEMFGNGSPHGAHFATFLKGELGAGHVNDLLGVKDEYVGSIMTGSDGGVRKLKVSFKRVNLNDEHWRVLGMVSDVTSEYLAEQEQLKMEKVQLTDRMARILAHEVRNPLTNIQLSVDHLAEALRASEELKMYVDIIGRNAVRIDGLITRILESVKPFDVTRETVDIKSTFNALKGQVEDRRELMEVKLNFRIDSKEKRWNIDPDKLEMALNNLVTNSFEAMSGTGEPQLDIGLQDVGVHWLITLKDNGKGMSDEARKHVFDAFYSHRKGGMGLGMTMVKNIINAHNGRIEVESTEGEGTTFRVWLPKTP